MKAKQYQLLIGILVFILVSLIAFMLLRNGLDISSKVTEKNCNKIMQGMTQDEVQAILGKIESKLDWDDNVGISIQGNKEYWYYSSKTGDNCYITFLNERVFDTSLWEKVDELEPAESVFNSGEYEDLSPAEKLLKFNEDISENFESKDEVNAKELIKLKEADYSDLSPAEKLMKLSEGVSEAAN